MQSKQLNYIHNVWHLPINAGLLTPAHSLSLM